MKKKILNFWLLTLMVMLGGMNAWGADVNATLDHTAGAQWGSNTGASTVDAEKEHYNNDAASSWAGCAYAKFSFTLPEGHSITKATLTYSVNQGGKAGRNDIIYFMKKGFDLDWANFAGQTATDLRNAGDRAGKAVASAPTGGTGDRIGLVQDVTDAVKAIYGEGQSYIIFQWTGNAGGADLYGKASANAPTLVIETADASSVTSYTVRFTDGTNDLKDAAIYDGVMIGSEQTASAEDMASFKANEKKYIYSSGNTTITLAADAASNVITLVFREAAIVNYTLTDATTGTLLAEGTGFEEDVVNAYYPHYILSEGNLYECPKQGSNPWYGISLTLGASATSATVNYTAVELAGVVFASEGEAIPGASKNTGNYADIRSFGGAVGYSAEDLVIVKLSAGKYKIKADLFTPTSAMGSQKIKVGEQLFTLTSENNGYHNEVETEEFEITEATDVVWVGGSTGTNAIDWLYITGTGSVVEDTPEDVLPLTLTFPDYNDASISAYTAEWTATVDGKVWTLNGFNNNKNDWAFVRCGQKSVDQTATITSPVVNAEAKNVVITVDKTSNVTAATLDVLNGENVVTTIDITEKFVAGDVNVPVEGAKGYSYKLTIQSTAGSNGTTQISKVAIYAEGQYKEPAHIANTAETAYTVTEAIALIDAGESLSETVFVKGIISKVENYNENYKSITYWISEDGTEEAAQFECYSGKGLDGADFESIDDVKVGASVIVTGTLTKYNEIYEFNSGNKLVSYEAPAVPEDVDIIDLATFKFNNWNGVDADAVATSEAGCEIHLGEELGTGAMVYGDSRVYYLAYADLTGCSKMIIEGTPGMQLRVMMNRPEPVEGGDPNGGKQIEKNPTIGDNGKAEIDLTELAYVHLNAIKTGWGSPAGTITAIKLVKPSDPLALPKEALKNAIAAAKLQNAVAKTEESFAALTAAIASAEAALAAADATEESLVAAKAAVEEAVAGLTLAEGYENLTQDIFKKWDSATEPTTGEATGCALDLFVSSGLPYGDGNVALLNFADLSEYDQLIVTMADGTPRILFNRDVENGQWNEDEAQSHLIESVKEGWSSKYFSNEGNVYYTDLKQMVADKGFAHLHSIKGLGGASVVVTGLYLKKATDPEPEPTGATVTYAMQKGETHVAGEAVTVFDEEGDAAATLTFGFAGEADFKAAKENASVEGFVAFTEGNGSNGTAESGTTYIITPEYDGKVEVAVVLNANKAFYVLENETALPEYDGIKVDAKYYGTYSFDVKGGSTYKVYCTGSKLGFYGFNYTFEKPQPMISGTIDFQELCMKLGKGGPWPVNDGGDAGFTVGETTMHFLGDYAEQGEEFVWGNRFAYEYVEVDGANRGKFTFRNKNNKKDKNCGLFSWDFAHNFSILGLKKGDKVTITTLAGTTTFVSTNVEGGVEAGATVESDKAYVIDTEEKTTRLDLNMAAATLISKIIIEKAGTVIIPTINISRETLALIPGATQKLTASVNPASAEVKWLSDNEAVATVAEDGTVTAVAAGTANISLQWTEDATVADAVVVTVNEFNASDYVVAKDYDFTKMGDVAFELQSEPAGAIWNEANSKVNNVFFVTNEGLTDIAVQAAAGKDGKGWSIADGEGLYLGKGAGRCAAINVKAGQVVELFYTGEGFYTGSKNDAVRKDDGAAKTTLNEGVGRAIYKMDEDGLLGFELIKANAVTSINIYEEPKYFAGEDGKYYLQNVSTKKFWGAGNDWGTRASLVKHPEFVTLAKLEDGTYTLESQVSNGGTAYYFNGDYMDNDSPVSLTIMQAADGEWTIANGDNFYGYDGTSTVLGKNLDKSSEAAHWQIISEEEMLASLSNATTYEPIDATFLMLAPDFGRNNRAIRDQGKTGAWNVSDDCTNFNLSGGNNVNNNAESYHSTFTVSQVLANAPVGVYKLTAQGFYRQDDQVEELVPVFFANEETQPVLPKTGNENSMSDASVSFTSGSYTIDPIFVQVSEAGQLTVGVKNETASHQWIIWDNFELTYYGADASIDEVKNAAVIQQLADLRTKAEQEQGEVEVDAVKAALAEALAATENVEPTLDALNAAIATLNAAIEKADASLTAKNVLPKMKQLVDQTNVYTAEALNEYYTQWAAKYEDGTLTKNEAAALQDPFLVTGWHAAITVDNFLLSAWDTNPDFQDAPYYINTWSVEGNNDGSEFKVPFFEYWTGDGDSLGERTLTATMNNLEAGEYEVTAWARVRAKNGYEAPAYGITLQANEGEAVNVAAGQQVGESQFFLDHFTATGVVGEDGVLNIKFNVAADNNISWLSFQNVQFQSKAVLAAKDELQQHVETAQAADTEGKTEASVAALNAAIAAAQAVLNNLNATAAEVAAAQAAVDKALAGLKNEGEMEVVTPPADLATEDWMFNGYYVDSYGESYVNRIVKVGFSGSDVYIQGISNYLEEAWIQGTMNAEGNAITVAAPQYYGSLYNTYDIYFGLNIYDEENKIDEYPASIELGYDAETGVITIPETLLILEKTSPGLSFDGTVGYYAATSLKKRPDYQTVEVPENLVAEEWYFQGQNSTDSDTEFTVNVGFDGNDIYVQGLCTLLPEGWVKGTIDGTTATFATGQYFGMTNRGYDMFMLGYNKDGIADLVLTYDAEAGRLAADANNLMIINELPDELYYHDYYSYIEITKEAPAELVEIEAPENLKPTDYLFLADDATANTEESRQTRVIRLVEDASANTVERCVQVMFDGSDVYFKGLVGFLSESYSKGTLSEDGKTITIPGNQYVGMTYDIDYDTWQFIELKAFLWGASKQDGSISDLVLNYDAESGKMTTDQYILVNGSRRFIKVNELYDNARLEIPEIATPAMPTIIDVVEEENYFTEEMVPAMKAEIPLVDIYGDKIYAPFLSYRVYKDVNGIQEPFIFDQYAYYEYEDLKNVPYTKDDDVFFYEGASLVLILTDNFDLWKRIGLRSIYTVNGKVRESEIFWFNIGIDGPTVGIDGINANDLNAEFYDMQGRKVARTAKGLLIKQQQQADGTVKTVKVVRK